MSKSGSTNPSTQILDYLKDQNRPYSAIDIFNNLHKEHGKTAVVKALDILVSEGKVKEKLYGKQKIYFVEQNEFSQSKESDLQQMDAEIANLNHTLNCLNQQIKAAENELNSLSKTMTTEEARNELSALNMEIPKLENRLLTLKSKSVLVLPSEKEAINKAKIKYCKEWRKRKRLANDMIDAILEGYPKDKKHLLEEIGIETDGDLQVFEV